MRENFKDLKKETQKIQGFSSSVQWGHSADLSVICTRDNAEYQKDLHH